jgi:uncharacterized membrane protein
MGELLHIGLPFLLLGARGYHILEKPYLSFVSTLEGFSACSSRLYHITDLVFFSLVMALLDGESPAGY